MLESFGTLRSESNFILVFNKFTVQTISNRDRMFLKWLQKVLLSVGF
jgi:hypothetical protein